MEDFLTHTHFSNLCDFVFAKNNFPENSESGIITIDINTNITLNSGNIIYTKTDYLPFLFQILRNQTALNNIILITHESDFGITKELFETKPSSISKWYAVNVKYDNPDLMPLPLGLSHRYYKKTHIVEPPNNLDVVENKKLLYINHRYETFPEGRKWIYDEFSTNDWCTVDQPNLTLDEYKKKLTSHKFIVCPKGNGIDSCRVWECLYYGIIPIVEDHISYKTLDDLPAIRVPSFRILTKDFLLEQEKIFKHKIFNMEKLKASWWIDQIRKNTL